MASRRILILPRLAGYMQRDLDSWRTDTSRLSRYRELAGVLGERAVLLQTVLQKRPARTPVAFGPDGHLYKFALLSSPRQGIARSIHLWRSVSRPVE